MSQIKASGWPLLLSVPVVFGASVAASCIITAVTIGPNIEGIGHVLIPLVCAIPLSIILVGVQEFRKKLKDNRGAIPLLLVYPVLFGLLFGYTIFYERNPQHMFRVIVTDPIPAGVTDIRAKDVSAGFDADILFTFRASSEVVDSIIAQKQLEKRDDPTAGKYNFPNDYFPEYVWGTEWVYYQHLSSGSARMMWVNPQQSIVIYRVWG